MDDDEKVSPFAMISFISLIGNFLRSSYVSIWDVSSITRSSENFEVKILCHYISNCRMSLIRVEYYRCSARQQIRKVIVLLVQSIDDESFRGEERKLKYRSQYGTILPIFLAIPIILAISFFMSSQLPSGNIIRGANLLYTYLFILSSKAERLRFSKYLEVEHFRKCNSCNLSRSIILSKHCPVHYRTEISSAPHHTTCTSKGTLVCPSVSQPSTDLSIRIFASNFPKESVINETPGDTETLDGTKPDRNRDFARSILPRRDEDANGYFIQRQE